MLGFIPEAGTPLGSSIIGMLRKLRVFCFVLFCPPVLVTQLRPTLCDPMDCNPPGISVRGILQARILEWVAISFSRGSGSNPAHLHYTQILYCLSHQAAHWFPDQGSDPHPLQWKWPTRNIQCRVFRASCHMLNIITSIQINSIRSRCSDSFISTSK